MNCYYCENIDEPPVLVTLSENESRHALASRRQQVGDVVALIDGKGVRAQGIIDTMTHTKVDIQVKSRLRIQKQKPEIILASAVPKGERQRIMLDMMSQLGVDEFVPLHCDRSVVKPNSANIEKWSRVCLEACKQSHNPFLPLIAKPQRPVEFIQKMSRSEIPVWIADPRGSSMKLQASHGSVVLCIGPEGGFSPNEKKEMLAVGAQLFGLGENILRVETAVVIAIHTARQSTVPPFR